MRISFLQLPIVFLACLYFSILYIFLPSFITSNSYLQAIIQGLREAGVFRSVITSAQASTTSKDEFLASIKSSNSTKAVSSQSLPSRKLGRDKASQATSRKAFDTSSSVYHEAAVPPDLTPAYG